MSNPGDRSRVLTLVFTDLADSTALKTEHGDAAVDALITRHREHVVRLAEACSGRVIDWAGDGCFLTFETSSAAVMFALQLQQAHAEEPDLPGVRIGVHLGEVTERSGPDASVQVKGLAVDVAARVQGLAKPGQVLMSSSVYNSARQRMGVDTMGQPILWQLHGLYDLKGMDHPLEIGEAGLEGMSPLLAPEAGEKARPVASGSSQATREPKPGQPLASRKSIVPALMIAAIVILGLAVAYLFTTRQTAPGTPDTTVSTAGDLAPITSLAVLPLDNMSGDPQQNYFADSMTEAITSELAKIKALKVISRTSVMQYKETIKTMPEIAAELGVEGLIEGSVIRDGDQVRITVQLIHGPSDTHLWSQSYTETITSVLKLQSDVALAIAEEINASISPQEQQRVAAAREVDPEAYDNFLLGEHFLDEKTEEGFEEAIQYFEKATEIDPEFAEAWVGQSLAYSGLAGWGISAPQEARPKARTAAMRALELDPEFADAHRALGRVSHGYDWEWVEAERRYRRALELNPNDPDNHGLYGWLLMQLGRTEEALQQAQTALDLDPNSADTVRESASMFAASGDWEQAISMMEGVYRANPDHIPLLDGLSWSYLETGRLDDAIRVTQHWVEVGGEETTARLRLAWVYSHAGREDEARELLAELRADSDEHYVSHTGAAWVHLGLGEMDEAFEAFEKGLRNRDWFTTWMRIFPSWSAHQSSGLVEDPRYWDLIKRMNYPPLPEEHPLYADEQAWLARKAAAEEANAPIRKIAVLPFENMSSDPEQEFFVDGMTEALISELAKIKSLKVISRTSVMRYKNTDKSLTEIARELGVDAVVEGSVLKAGDSVRITAQLIHGLTDEHLWSASRTAPLEDILKLQAEVALSMTDEINAAVTPEERSRIAAAPVVDSRAYTLYIEGRALWSERTAEGFAGALDRYEKALEFDPNFALAHLGLADTYMQLVDYLLESPIPAYERARHHIERVFELGDPPGEAYSSRGRLKTLRDMDWLGAEADFQRALQLNPADPTARLWYSVILEALGRQEEAVQENETAYELDPFSPVIAGMHLQRLADFGSPEEALQRAGELELEYPDSSRVVLSLSYAYRVLGQCEDAVAASRRQYTLRAEDLIGSLTLAQTMAHCGETQAARNLLETILPRVEELHSGATRVASVYTVLGEPDRGLEWLERAVEWRDPHVVWMNFAPEFEEMYDHPGFQDLLRRLNFPERDNESR